MWAVLICTHTGGGESTLRIAMPSTRVDSTRERTIDAPRAARKVPSEMPRKPLPPARTIRLDRKGPVMPAAFRTDCRTPPFLEPRRIAGLNRAPYRPAKHRRPRLALCLEKLHH